MGTQEDFKRNMILTRVVSAMQTRMHTDNFALGDMLNNVSVNVIEGLPEEDGGGYGRLVEQIRDAMTTSQNHADALRHIIVELGRGKGKP